MEDHLNPSQVIFIAHNNIDVTTFPLITQVEFLTADTLSAVLTEGPVEITSLKQRSRVPNYKKKEIKCQCLPLYTLLLVRHKSRVKSTFIC